MTLSLPSRPSDEYMGVGIWIPITAEFAYTDLPHGSFWFPSRLSWLRVLTQVSYTLAQKMNYSGSVQSTAHNAKTDIVPRLYNRLLWSAIWVPTTFLASLALFYGNVLRKIARCDVSWELIVLESSKVPILILQFRSSLRAGLNSLRLCDDLICIDLISTPNWLPWFVNSASWKRGQFVSGPWWLYEISWWLWILWQNYTWSIFGDICEIFGSPFCNFPPWRTISSCVIAASGC